MKFVIPITAFLLVFTLLAARAEPPSLVRAEPADGATDHQEANVSLCWRPGRGAISHKVYFSSDKQAVIDSMALAGILSSQIIYQQFVAGFPAYSCPATRPDLLVDRRKGARTAVPA